MDKTVPISCGPCPSGFTGNGKNCIEVSTTSPTPKERSTSKTTSSTEGTSNSTTEAGVDRNSKKVPTTEDHPGSLNPTHIGLICAGVVFIAVVVIIACYRCKTSTRIQARRIEVEEATPADDCLRPEKYEMTEVTSEREKAAWLEEIFNQGMELQARRNNAFIASNKKNSVALSQ